METTDEFLRRTFPAVYKREMIKRRKAARLEARAARERERAARQDERDFRAIAKANLKVIHQEERDRLLAVHRAERQALNDRHNDEAHALALRQHAELIHPQGD